MKIKTSIIILFALFGLNETFAQSNLKSYIVNLNNDTISITPKKMSARRIVCLVNNEEKKFRPKEILAYKFNDAVGESAKACGMVIGIKRWTYLDRKITGKVCLYYINMYDKDIGTGNYSKVTVHFYRKPEETRGKIYKFWSWGKLESYLNDCPKFVEKLNSKEGFKTLNDEILYYNANCN